MLVPLFKVLFEESLRVREVVDIVDHLVLDAELDHAQAVVEGNGLPSHILEIICTYEVDSDFLGGCVVIDEGPGVVEASEHRDAGTFLEGVQPIALDLASDGVASLNPRLDGSLPDNHDVLVLVVPTQNGIPELKNLMLNQVHNLVDCVGLQTPEIWNVVNELLPLVHILIVVAYHIVVDARMH